MIMKPKQLLIALVFTASLLFVTQTASAQFIAKFGFSTDAEGKDVKVVVDPGTKLIYCFATTPKPLPDMTFKFVWTHNDLVKQEKTKVFTQELSNQAGTIIASKYAPPGGLKDGTYEVDMFVDGNIRKHARLIVQKDRH